MPQLSTLPTPSIIPSPDTHSCPLRPPRPAGVPSGAGWPRGQGRVARAGGQGRWPCWEPCPREDVTTCFWCALASGSINALLAAGTSCTAGHGRGDGHLDTDPRGDGHLDSHTHTHRGTLAQPPDPPCTGDTATSCTSVSQTGGTGGQMSHAGGTNHPRQGQMLCGAEGEQGSPGLSGAGEAAASRLIANYPRYSVSDTL